MNRNDTLNSEFVPYKIALALKELGFDEPCFGFFWVTENHTSFLHIEFMIGKMNRLNKLNILRPTFSQAFRWFREKYDLVYFITPEGSIDNRCYLYSIKDYKAFVGTFGQTYEEAELECLKKLIEIVKKEIK